LKTLNNGGGGNSINNLGGFHTLSSQNLAGGQGLGAALGLGGGLGGNGQGFSSNLGIGLGNYNRGNMEP
jgi:hypothetical protein